MATVAAIAIKRSLATQRIAEAASAIAKQLGVESLDLPLTNRDPQMLHANQLTALADYLEVIEQAVKPESGKVGNVKTANKRPARKATQNP